MKLDWLTDVHQDFLSPQRQQFFVDRLMISSSDAIVVTGDISTGRQLEEHMTFIAERVSKPIYYVLGNHDFWYSSVDEVHEICKGLEKKFPHLQHLNNKDFISLKPDVALVGHDGWYDAQNGNWKKSNFEMPDWYFIKDFVTAGASRFVSRGHYEISLPHVVGKARALAFKSIVHIESGVASAIATGHKRIIIATHVPPFEESHIHNGKVGDDRAQPWFTCAMLGDSLLTMALQNPDHVFVSLSGHTHGSYSGKKSHNLYVHVGGARYGHPDIASVLEL